MSEVWNAFLQVGAVIQRLVSGESFSQVGLLGVYLVALIGEFGIPFPLVMQTMLLYAGYELATGNLYPLRFVLVAMAGSESGATLLYWLARSATKLLSPWLAKALNPKNRRLSALGARLKDGQGKVIAVGRVIPGLMVPLSLMAGILHFSYPRFTFWVFLSELLWVSPFLLLGIGLNFGAEFNPALAQWLTRWLWLLIVGGFVLVLALRTLIKRLRKQNQTSST